jgi:hypothetical protein
MGGQFVVLIPDKDAVVVFTANARNTQRELNLLHDYLIPAIKSDKPLTADPLTYNELLKRQSTLEIKTGSAAVTKPDIEAEISGREFIMEDNDYRIQSVYFTFGSDECGFALKRDNRISKIKAGLNLWKTSNSSLTSLLTPLQNPPSKSIDANYTVPYTSIKVGATFAWTDENTLELTARFIEESLGPQTVVCKFSEMGGTIRVSIEQKASAGAFIPGFSQPQVRIRGTLVNIN